jgi:DNA polymerase-3 subunit epsilon
MERRSRPPAPAGQRRFDDLGAPLHDVTFCVIDLETTGGSRHRDAITEVAAVRYRGGERLDSLVTLVNPGVPIPPTITYLTGITEAMLAPAPPIAPVLAALQELIRPDDVIVGHNVGFDIGFLDEALLRHGWPRLGRRSVDTVRIARRLLRDEVPDCRLGTLAACLGLRHRPCHRALADVEATAELLHLMLERVAGLGITGLDDLLSLPTIGGHPEAAKLRLTAALPRRPGVYLFRDRGGTVLYVGKATDLRSRVRQYFGGDDRRKVTPLLHVTHRIDHVECASAVHAAVLETRLIRRHRPRFNDVSAHPESATWVRVSGVAGRPRISTTRAIEGRPPSAWFLGPFPGSNTARAAAMALTEACTALDPAAPLDPSTVLDRPDQLLAPLADRLLELAQLERFEAAAAMRDRASLLARAIARQRRADAILRPHRLELELRSPIGPVRLRIHGGRLQITADEVDLSRLGDAIEAADLTGPRCSWAGGAVPADLADELNAVIAVLDRDGSRLSLLAVERDDGHGVAWPARRAPSFDPRRDAARRLPVGSAPAATVGVLERVLLPSMHGHRAGAADHRRGAGRPRGRGGVGRRGHLGADAPQDPRRAGAPVAGTLPLDREP